MYTLHTPIYYQERYVYLPSYPPVCPPLEEALDAELSSKAATLAEQLLKIHAVWSELGIKQFTWTAPSYDRETDSPGMQATLDYELARRTASLVCAEHDKIRLVHRSGCNRIILSATCDWESRMATATDKLARQAIEELYQSTEPGTTQKIDNVAELTMRHADKNVLDIHPQTRSVLAQCRPHLGSWSHQLHRRLSALAEESYSKKGDCVWRFESCPLELMRVEQALNWWQRFGLRVNGWSIALAKETRARDKMSCC